METKISIEISLNSFTTYTPLNYINLNNIGFKPN